MVGIEFHSFRPLTRIHLLLTDNRFARSGVGFWFPTSDEDSSTPDLVSALGLNFGAIGFRPLTRIHLLLTTLTAKFDQLKVLFPTSDEDSSTPDLRSSEWRGCW